MQLRRFEDAPPGHPCRGGRHCQVRRLRGQRFCMGHLLQRNRRPPLRLANLDKQDLHPVPPHGFRGCASLALIAERTVRDDNNCLLRRQVVSPTTVSTMAAVRAEHPVRPHERRRKQRQTIGTAHMVQRCKKLSAVCGERAILGGVTQPDQSQMDFRRMYDAGHILNEGLRAVQRRPCCDEQCPGGNGFSWTTSGMLTAEGGRVVQANDEVEWHLAKRHEASSHQRLFLATSTTIGWRGCGRLVQ
mmetsp:Transcript_64066/g.185660  ORF Transcript_64066/g.185660 Transcript_64066/m.185660 type:complete len:245 (+) Transcript_64066:529-1263(+)